MSATVILASAGTGKTRRLTDRMIALVARGTAPESILASTFTRKAAGEILERVFQRLVDAATDERARAELERDLALEPASGEAWLARLANLARGVHRFRVQTLDAFFVRLAQLHGPALDLPAEWRIVEETADARTRADALGLALERTDHGVAVALLRALREREGAQSVHGALLEVVRESLDAFAESDESAWRAVEAPDGPSDEEWARVREALSALEPPLSRTTGQPNQSWSNCLANLREALEAGDPRALLANGLIGKVADGEGSYARVEIPADVRAHLSAALERAVAEIGRRLVARNLANHRLVARFDAEYAALRRARRALRFEHFPRALVRAGALAAPNQLGARLGAPIDHVLLDEFQDTSPQQWRALAPLVDELARRAGSGGSVFVVGDAKQSIYGWRQAEPRLLESLPERFDVESEALVLNYRSAPAVIDAVNAVFGGIATNAAIARDESSLAAAEHFARLFAPHSAAKSTLAGRVRLVACAVPSHPMRPNETALPAAAARAAELHRAEPERTVAILVRTKKVISRLLYDLQALGVPASEEGGNPLTDSAAVNVALSALELADHPANSAAGHHVATSPLGAALGLARDASRSESDAVGRRIRRELAERGYGRFLAALEPRVRATYGGWDGRRFGQLVELGFARDAERPGLRPTEFVEEVCARRVEDPLGTPVKVMTIHAAKGLEFDSVLLPELGVGLKRASRRLVTRRRGEDPADTYDVVSDDASEIVRARMPFLDRVARGARVREMTEHLCTLYVAMTRAVRRLEIFVAGDSKERDASELPLSLAGILRAALTQGSAPPETVPYEHGEFAEPESGPARAADLSGEVEDARIELAPSRGSRERVRVAPSSLEGGAVIDVRRLFDVDRAARRRGSRLHAWFEAVEWVEGAALDPRVLAALAERAGLEGDDFQADLAAFERALAAPAVRELLSRSATEARLGSRTLDLWRERPFCVALDASTLSKGAFDRVTIAREGGRAVRAELVDFKTDRVSERELDPRVELYRPQVLAYRAALARILSLDEARIAVRLAFVDAGSVRGL